MHPRLIWFLFSVFAILSGLLGVRLYQSLQALRPNPAVLSITSPHLLTTISFEPSRAGVIAANPTTRQVFAAQEDVPALANIDAGNNLVVAAPALGGYHTGIAINEVANEIFVSQEFSKTVRVLDGNKGVFLREFPVPGGSPIGELAFDPADNQLYVIENDLDAIAILDVRRGELMGTIPLNAHYGDLTINPQAQRLYISSPLQNQLTVVDTVTNQVVATLPTGKNPRTIAVNSATNRIYVAIADDNVLAVFDGQTNALLATIPVGQGPVGVAVNPLTNRIYVSNFAGKDISIIDGDTNTVVNVVSLQDVPLLIAVLPELGRIYVSSDEAHGVYVIQDKATDAAQSLVLASDETVKQTEWEAGTPPSDWHLLTVDDGSWRPAVREHCTGRDPMPAYNQAAWIWDGSCVQSKQALLFRKTFDLPNANYRGVLRLRADEQARVFMNGQALGEPYGWTTEFWYDLTPYLRQGKNVLAIQTVNEMGYGEMMFRADVIAR